jgi:alpha-L-rhamnosidase
MYLNGRLVGQGPSYHYPQYQYYNAYDVKAFLFTNQKNVFAVLTHWFGAGQGRPENAPGLILKAVIEYADGTRTVAGTNGDWKQRRAESWRSGTPARNDEGVGYVEVIDAAGWIPDWNAANYDDSDWDFSTEIGPHPTPPWVGALFPDLTRIVEQAIAPVAIADKGGGTYVIDLGRVYAGRPRIRFSGGRPGTLVEMRGGYTLKADGTVDPNTSQNTNLSFSACLNGGEFSFLPQEYLGMRYFQVDHSPEPIMAKNFAFIERHADLDDNRSTFSSANPVLNRVWDVLKNSVKPCAQESFVDTPSREKGGFLVDSLNESLAAMAAYGERLLTRKALVEFLQSMEQYWSTGADQGRMNAVYPNGDGARDIPDFTQAYLWWVWQYYLQTGDLKFLRQYYPQLKSIANYVQRHQQNDTGLIHRLTGGGDGEYRHGIVDWPPSMRYGYDIATEARMVINAYAYLDYITLSNIAAELGNTTDRDTYHILAEGLKTAINERLVNAEGLYVDGLYADGKQSTHISQHANMFPLALGLVPAERREAVLAAIKDRKMSVGMVTVYWLILALGEADQGEHLIDLYTNPEWDGWAKSIARGATCTWESWDADKGGVLSQSHGWGAVGLCGIQQYVLGIKPLAPQFEKIQVKPLDFGSKLANAGGRVPTERGDIQVSWKREADHFQLALSLPVNMQARVCLPKLGGLDATVRVDGEVANGVVEGNYIAVDDIGSGAHTFERIGS